LPGLLSSLAAAVMGRSPLQEADEAAVQVCAGQVLVLVFEALQSELRLPSL
jgi:hypothetical protein